MKTTIVNKHWHFLLLAIAILYQIAAAIHVVSLLIQALVSRSLTPLGIVSIFDLRVFFPAIQSSFWESLGSILIYITIVLATFYWLRSLHITIEKKK